MSVFTKVALSGALNGLPIKVAATSSPGTLVHTAISGTNAFDEVWIWVVNNDSADREVCLQWGGTTSPDHEIWYNVLAKDGPKCITPGFILQNGLIIRAYCSTGNVLQVHGFINRIVN